MRTGTSTRTSTSTRYKIGYLDKGKGYNLYFVAKLLNSDHDAKTKFHNINRLIKYYMVMGTKVMGFQQNKPLTLSEFQHNLTSRPIFPTFGFSVLLEVYEFNKVFTI